MNINLTIIGQIITFFIFLFFTMKFVWPPINQAMEKRKDKILQGLKYAKDAENKMITAKSEADLIIKKAKKESKLIINNSQQQSTQIMKNAEFKAKNLTKIMLSEAKKEIDYNINVIKNNLINETANLAIFCAEKILHREININDNKKLIQQTIEKM